MRKTRAKALRKAARWGTWRDDRGGFVVHGTIYGPGWRRAYRRLKKGWARGYRGAELLDQVGGGA